MPELPEVETLKRELSRAVVGKKIKAIHSNKFILPLPGKKIVGLNRRAKILIFDLSSGDHLLIHLKMTGQLIFIPKKGKLIMGGHPDDPTKYTRATLTFTDNSKLLFNDLRKFGWLRVVTTAELGQLLANLGPEPLSKQFTLEAFEKLLNRYPARRVKQVLLDQTLIAGLGNIYVDEACFLARILPTRSAKSLKPKERRDLHQAIIAVLKLSIAKKGTSFRNYRRSGGTPGGMVAHLKVYGRAKQACKKCGKEISKIKIAGRGTHFCPKCQR